jgi:hypothetical protein
LAEEIGLEIEELVALAGDLSEMSPEELEEALLRWIATSPLNPLDGLSGSGEFVVAGAVAAGTLTGAAGTLAYSLLGASASGSGHYGIDGATLTAAGQFHADAHLLNVEYNAELAGIEIAADAWVGAEVDAQGELVFDPISGTMVASASVSAFAGVRAGVEGQADLGLADVSGHAGVRAGIGVEGNAEAGYRDGVLSLEFSFGAALGVGFDTGFDVDLDIGGAADTLVDAGGAVVDFVGSFF